MTSFPDNPYHPEEGFREISVLRTINDVEVPLLQVAAEKFRDSTILNNAGKKMPRGWALCGPLTIALTHIINTRTRVPIQLGGKNEHLEMIWSTFNPKAQTQESDQQSPHLSINYYTGQGSVMYVDPVYKLLWEGRTDLEGSIRVAKYPIDSIDQELEQYHLYPPDHPLGNLSLTHNSPEHVNNYLAAVHGPFSDIASDSPFADRPQWWVNKISAIIKKIEPKWSNPER